MLSRNSRRIDIANKLIDLFIVNLSWWIAYYLRFESNLLQADEGLFPWYLKFSILLTFINYYYFRREGLYSSRRLTTLYQDFFSTLKANSVAFTVLIICVYFLSGHKLSRLFILTHYFLSSVGLLAFKLSARKLLRNFRANGSNSKSCLLVGNSAQIQQYADKLARHPEFGIHIMSWVKAEDELSALGIGEIEAMRPDMIVFGVENKHWHLVNKLLLDLNNLLIEIIVLPDLSHAFVGYQVVDMAGTTAILINEPNMRSRSVIIKRLFDLVLCSIGIVVISPVLILIALLIKLTSKGPVLYSQVRMGLDGREFKMYKFRSMTSDGANKETWTVKDDPRVTPIGRIIRKTSLDELPQLFNVIMGDMSLVGPRPERPVYVNQFRQNIPTYMLRHKMKAGITGWAQINGWRGDTSIEKRIECDLYYIKNWSIWMDLWIIFMTFWKGFINKNAY